MSGIHDIAARQATSDTMDDPLMLLSQPGIARALNSLSNEILGQVLAQALHRNRADLAAGLIRDLDTDPRAIGLAVHPTPNPNSNNYSLQRTQFDISLWGRIQDALGLNANDLAKNDWMTLLHVSAKALDGREREQGINTVKKALHRTDVRDEAITEFPALFRGARDIKQDITALGILADLSPQRGDTTESLKRTIKALGGIDLKPSPTDLINAACSQNLSVRSAFADVYGAHALVNASTKDGKTALEMAAVYIGFNSSIAWLIENGADPMHRDNAGETVLQTLARIQAPLNSVAELMRHAQYDQSHLKDTIDQYGGLMTPDVAALLQAQMARLSLSAIAAASQSNTLPGK